MPLNLDTMRLKLKRQHADSQMVVSQENYPRALAMLKEHGVVGPRCARCTMVSLSDLQAALAGQRRDHVAAVMRLYMSVIPRQGEPLQPEPAAGSDDEEVREVPASQEQPQQEQQQQLVVIPQPRQQGAASTSSSSPTDRVQAMLERLQRTLADSSKRKRDEDDLQSEQRDWPRTLPDLMFPTASLRADYSITTMLPDYQQDSSIPLDEELRRYEAWCTEPVDLTRNREYSAPIQQITFAGAQDIIHGFMGFMFKVGKLNLCLRYLPKTCEAQNPPCPAVMLWLQLKATPASQLSTRLMEDPHSVAAYAAFLVARKVVSSTLVRHVAAIKKVLAWRSTLGGTQHAHARLEAVIKWTDALQRQCQHAAPPPMAHLQRTRLPHARDVLAWQLAVQEHADAELAADLLRHGRIQRVKTLRACHDAAMLDMMYGYLPPPRLSCIRYVWTSEECVKVPFDCMILLPMPCAEGCPSGDRLPPAGHACIPTLSWKRAAAWRRAADSARAARATAWSGLQTPTGRG